MNAMQISGTRVLARRMSGSRRPIRFDRLIDRSEDDSLKWSRYEKDVIPMWVADMDFRSPEPIVRAVTARARTGVYGYAAPSDNLKSAIVKRLNTVYGSPNESAKPEWICWLPGLVSGLSHSVRAFVPHEETAISYTPIYPPFLKVSGINERRLEKIPLLRADVEMQLPQGNQGKTTRVCDFSLNMTQTEEVMKRDDVKLLLMCSPHNPSGRIWKKKELIDLAKMCVENDVVICCDEVWGEIVLPFSDSPFVSMLSLIEEVEGLEERLVVLTSPSKVFNVAGLDLAYAVIPNSKLRMKFKQAGADKSEIPHFGFDACEVAYTDRSVERWRRELVYVT